MRLSSHRYSIFLALIVLATLSVQGQDAIPDPASPPSPTEYSECDDLETRWDDLFKHLSGIHDDCLKSAKASKEKYQPGADMVKICEFGSCQSAHTRKYDINGRARPAVTQCRAKVRQHKEAERLRAAAEAERQSRIESERRRLEQERRASELAEREAATSQNTAAQRQILAQQSAETQRRETAAATQRANEEARQRVLDDLQATQTAAAERDRTIDAAVQGAFAPIMQALEARRQQKEAEEEAAAARYEEEARQAAERERLRIAEERRLAAEAAARRARQGAYTRKILETEAAEREKEELARLNAKTSTVGTVDKIEAEMNKNRSPADEVYGPDARASINAMSPSLRRQTPDAGGSGAESKTVYEQVTPPDSSPFGDVFRKVVNGIDIGRWSAAEKGDGNRRAVELLLSKLSERVTPSEGVNRLRDRAYKFAVTRMWKSAIEVIRDQYARERSTPKGERTPDPVQYQYYRAEAAAHPATGLWLELLRSRGRLPLALYRSLSELVNRTVNTVGLVGTGTPQ